MDRRGLVLLFDALYAALPPSTPRACGVCEARMIGQTFTRRKRDVSKHFEELTITPLSRRRGEKLPEIRGRVKTDGLLSDQEAVVSAVDWLRGLDMLNATRHRKPSGSTSADACRWPHHRHGRRWHPRRLITNHLIRPSPTCPGYALRTQP